MGSRCKDMGQGGREHESFHQSAIPATLFAPPINTLTEGWMDGLHPLALTALPPILETPSTFSSLSFSSIRGIAPSSKHSTTPLLVLLVTLAAPRPVVLLPLSSSSESYAELSEKVTALVEGSLAEEVVDEACDDRDSTCGSERLEEEEEEEEESAGMLAWVI